MVGQTRRPKTKYVQIDENGEAVAEFERRDELEDQLERAGGDDGAPYMGQIVAGAMMML